MSVVLVVDDVQAMVEQYVYDLERLGGHETRSAAGGAEALELMESEAIDCVILDLEMPGVDGFEVLRVLKERGSTVPVIVYTGTGNYDRCVHAVRLGAYSFIDKTEPMAKVIQEVANALEQRKLASEVSSLRRRLEDDTPLRGASPAMEQLRDAIRRLAPVPSPVLIVGESGVGKELVARELHRLSPHAAEPFVAVNSAALPEHLVESELFGHERGAFTGAHRLHAGAFERAGRGTMFLDEVGELPAPVQAKLLRVLEEREVMRVGGSHPLSVEARVIAASNRNIEQEVAAGRFREDLYYRLNVHIVSVPALRDRLSDIPDLVEHFLTSICRRFGVRTKRPAPGTMQLLMQYRWQRNNVRELRNIVERMIIAADGEVIEPAHVPSEIRSPDAPYPAPQGATFKQRKAEAERRILIEALERHEWHITETARALGLADHASLLKIMRRHNLKQTDKRVDVDT
jgi:two-component system nitrogen regulation response regulator NtrX